MALDRLQRLSGLWSWLPAFRAAAEYESLQRAALALGLSPSALSRTVKQLEDRLGFPVFERLATGVRLTPGGQRLLEATRDAMRRVDDALAPEDSAPLRIGAVPPFLPALAARALADLTPMLISVGEDDVAGALLRGDADVVLCHQTEEDPRLEQHRLEAVPMVAAQPPGAAGQLGLRVDDLAALFTLAAAQKRGVVVPAALVPAGFEVLAPHDALPARAVVRRPVSAAPRPGVVAALGTLGALTWR